MQKSEGMNEMLGEKDRICIVSTDILFHSSAFQVSVALSAIDNGTKKLYRNSIVDVDL